MDAAVVVVGAGTAGSVAARSLASAGIEGVVVIEPGGRTDDEVPRFFDLLGPEVLHEGLGFPQARALGGGSAVNAMILSGDEPDWLAGMTRTAREDEVGSVGRMLLSRGGRLCRLWWNSGRWNPARALLHAVEEGRVDLVRSDARRLVTNGSRVVAVETAEATIPCAHVVLCAGAVLTPRLLISSGLGPPVRHGIQNHPTLSFTVRRSDDDTGRFDTCTVGDLRCGGARGLLVAFERASRADDRHGLVSLSLMDPVSRGHVDADTVDFALLRDERDLRAMLALTREFLGRFSDASGLLATDASGTPLGSLAGLRDSSLSDWIAGAVHPVSHPASSCRDSVDARGRLAGWDNVTLADASVLDTVPRETPAAAVTIEARRVAAALAEDLT